MRRKTSNGLKLTASDETLYNLYVVKKMTLKEIGRRFDVTAQRVQQRLSSIGVSRAVRRRDIDPEILRSQYVDQHLSRQQIASRLGVSRHRVTRELQLNGIRRRTFLDELALKHPCKEIEQLYVRQGLWQADAAVKLGISLCAFRRLLEHYGIKQRHKPGVRLACSIENRDLQRLYIDEHRTVADIAVKYGCSADTIRRRLKKLRLHKRRWSRLPDDETLIELYTKKHLTYQQIGDRYGVTTSRVYQCLSAIGVRSNKKRVELDAAVLRRLYVDERLTQRAVAEQLGVSKVKVWEELRRQGISRNSILDRRL